MVCLKCHGVSALFSGVSIVFADVSRIVVVCPLCLLVFSECWDVSAFISGVTRMWSCARLVLWCVQDVVVFRPYLWCVQSVAVCPPCFLVCLLSFLVSPVLRFACLAFRCVHAP